MGFKTVEKASSINELSYKEVCVLVTRQQEELNQKDRTIKHLMANARKWVKKFDTHQLLLNEERLDIARAELLESFVVEKDALLEKQRVISTQNKNFVKRIALLTEEINKLKGEQKASTSAKVIPIAIEEHEEAKVLEFSQEIQESFAKYA